MYLSDTNMESKGIEALMMQKLKSFKFIHICIRLYGLSEKLKW